MAIKSLPTVLSSIFGQRPGRKSFSFNKVLISRLGKIVNRGHGVCEVSK